MVVHSNRSEQWPDPFAGGFLITIAKMSAKGMVDDAMIFAERT